MLGLWERSSSLTLELREFKIDTAPLSVSLLMLRSTDVGLLGDYFKLSPKARAYLSPIYNPAVFTLDFREASLLINPNG